MKTCCNAATYDKNPGVIIGHPMLQCYGMLQVMALLKIQEHNEQCYITTHLATMVAHSSRLVKLMAFFTFSQFIKRDSNQHPLEPKAGIWTTLPCHSPIFVQFCLVGFFKVHHNKKVSS